VRVNFRQATDRCFDVCIAGSGPAGIITALELARLRPDLAILLLEYGRPGMPERNGLDDTIRIGNPANHHDPYECTNKAFGGSSATWGGRCVMYDEVDFQPRAPFAEHCTWVPGILDELRPHLDRASEYFECGTGGFNLHSVPGVTYRPIAERFREGDVTDSTIERWSRPTRFGARYGRMIERSDSIRLLVGCQMESLQANMVGQITAATVRDTATGTKASIRADRYILATGAQEATRILLHSPGIFASRGGPPATLGRYYQGHVSGKIASVCFTGDPAATDYGFIRQPSGEYLRRRFQFSEAAMARHGLLNTAIWLDNPLYFDPQHRSGAMSFMYLAMLMPLLGRRLAPPAVAHSITRGKVNQVGRHLGNILRDLPLSLWIPASIFVRRYCMRRKLPGVFLFSRTNRYALHFHAEQLPQAGNAMRLSPDGRELLIDYAYCDYDIDSVLRAHEVLDRWLRATGCGFLEYWHPPELRREAIRSGSKDGVHQVGTTRMAPTADRGVVDGNLQVFGTTNLYVCSSSVFPTSGQANPTYLLGVFAVRLAWHLSSL
jgi:hypothetical protein